MKDMEPLISKSNSNKIINEQEMKQIKKKKAIFLYLILYVFVYV